MSIPKVQTGYGFKSGESKITKFSSLAVPTPNENEILLKVEAAGLCMSDPHLLHSQSPIISKDGREAPDEFVMGHEIAGSVVQVGSNLKNDPLYEKGARFALSIAMTCGVCESCRKGFDNACEVSSQAYGLNEHGGFQAYLLVRNLRSLLPIPDGVTFEAAAVSTDSVLTPFHAIQKVKQYFEPTTKVLVVGLGGLGLNALQILKVYGVKIVGVDIKASAEKAALQCGADEFYTDLDNSDHAYESFDFCFDFVGNQGSSEICQYFVKTKGKIVSIGLGRSKLLIRNFDLARREVDYIFCFGGTTAEQIECMKWVQAGKISPLYTVYDFNKLPQYLDKLVKGEIEGRAVFRPSKL